MSVERAMRQAAKNSQSNVWQSVFQATKLWYKLNEKQFSSIGLTLSEVRVLRSLSLNGASSMVTLAKDQQMTPGGMTGLVDHLEEEGLIQRDRSESDRRIINIEITKEGRKVVSRATSIFERFMEKSLESLTEEEIETFLRIMNKMISSTQDKEV